MDLIKPDPVDYDDISEGVRRFCAERFYELEKALRPFVDGTFGEILPGHLANYVATLRQLGALYQVTKPPRELQNLIPAAKVQEILAGMRQAHEAEIQAVTAAVEARVRGELAAGTQRSIESARTHVMDKLADLEKRGA
jgi:hypothetical protein